MTFAQRRNRLTTHFSERIPVVKRRVSVGTVWPVLYLSTDSYRRIVYSNFCHLSFLSVTVRIIWYSGTEFQVACVNMKVQRGREQSWGTYFHRAERYSPVRPIVCVMSRYPRDIDWCGYLSDQNELRSCPGIDSTGSYKLQNSLRTFRWVLRFTHAIYKIRYIAAIVWLWSSVLWFRSWMNYMTRA
jgi:hypothetical protein